MHLDISWLFQVILCITGAVNAKEDFDTDEIAKINSRECVAAFMLSRLENRRVEIERIRDRWSDGS